MNANLLTAFRVDMLLDSFVWTIAWQSTIVFALGLVLARPVSRTGRQSISGHCASDDCSRSCAAVDGERSRSGLGCPGGSTIGRDRSRRSRGNRPHLIGDRTLGPAADRSLGTTRRRHDDLGRFSGFRASRRHTSRRPSGEGTRSLMPRFCELLPTVLAACWIIASLALAVRLAVSLLREDGPDWMQAMSATQGCVPLFATRPTRWPFARPLTCESPRRSAAR